MRESDTAVDVARLVRELYAIVRQLEALFPGRRFTPDGHLVGSIGEVLAARRYGLRLLPQSTEGHDAEAAGGRLVQIKATQRRSIGLRSSPDHLIVLRLHPDGGVTEIFNGPGGPVWEQSGRMQKNGQRAIGLSKLEAIMERIPPVERLPQVVP